jgi:hypothetical protein
MKLLLTRLADKNYGLTANLGTPHIFILFTAYLLTS